MDYQLYRLTLNSALQIQFTIQPDPAIRRATGNTEDCIFLLTSPALFPSSNFQGQEASRFLTKQNDKSGMNMLAETLDTWVHGTYKYVFCNLYFPIISVTQMNFYLTLVCIHFTLLLSL